MLTSLSSSNLNAHNLKVNEMKWYPNLHIFSNLQRQKLHFDKDVKYD